MGSPDLKMGTIVDKLHESGSPSHMTRLNNLARTSDSRSLAWIRFHGLDAFDEGKRSCRNRLEGHNKRRRKPQPDPLGFSARFLPAFQDNSRLGQLFADRSSFLSQMRIPGVSVHWDDGNNPIHQQKGSWQQQRIISFEDQSAYECAIPAGAGMERQALTGLYPHPNDRSTLFSPQSPKGMIPGSSDVGSGPKTHQYFRGSVNPLGPSLSLTSSSGAGVLSGLEAIPVGQGFPRVSDSGRALSLQSTMQFLSSTQGMVADIPTHSNVITDQGLQSNHIPTAQPLVTGGGHQHHFEWAHEKLLSAASNLQSLSSTTGYQTGSLSMDKDHLEGPFAPGLNGVAGFDCIPMYSMFHGEVRLGDMPQDVKPTIDLMQVVTSASHGLNSQPLVSTGSFDLGVSHFQDLQTLRSYEPPMDDSPQEM
ncbi:hypothetical protein L7F22_018510 [Adiantum nelumboides]|nr:hypothetical protein [Adiantum nelumboides]